MWWVIILVPTIAAASAGFSPEQRAEAQTFIKDIFVQIRRDQRAIRKAYESAISAKDRKAEYLLNQSQINFRAVRELDEKRSVFEKKLSEAKSYKDSLKHSAEEICSWEASREEEALALLACVELMPEWQQYQNDPSNVHLYEQLHDKMRDIAWSLAPIKSEQSFISRSHAHHDKSDDQMNYDLDKIFFLTLYLLDKKLQEQKSSSVSTDTH